MPFVVRAWMVACAAALLCIAAGWISVPNAIAAIIRGANVYAFLFGIVAIAELCRYGRVFDVLAGVLLRVADGSRFALFGYVYVVGAIVTVFFSNDTTAVIMAPAVLGAVLAVGGMPRAYLFACAFVANAASFVLPISNPANLVVYGAALPRLFGWFTIFGWSSLGAIVVTFAALAIVFRRDIRGRYEVEQVGPKLERTGVAAAYACACAGAALVVATALGWHIGYVALAGALFSTIVVAAFDRGAVASVVRHSAWDVVLFVAALFVVVTAFDTYGGLAVVQTAFTAALHLGRPMGAIAIALGISASSAAVNNLPVGLVAGRALNGIASSSWVTHATMISVDLGPNFAASGSLATMLWLTTLRRDGVTVTWLEFLQVGGVVATPAILAALLLLR